MNRVYLRKPNLEDGDEFTQLMNLSVDSLYPWVYPPLMLEQFERYIERFDEVFFFGYLVCLKGDDTILGLVNITQVMRYNVQSGFIAYYLGSRYEGKGYMQEGVRLLLNHTFLSIGLHRLEANIQPGNTRSIALAKKLGFKKEGYSEKFMQINGIWKDHERWAILQDALMVKA